MNLSNNLELRLNDGSEKFFVNKNGPLHTITRNVSLKYKERIEEYALQTPCYYDGESISIYHPEIIGDTHNHPLIWDSGYPELELGKWSNREDIIFGKKYPLAKGIRRVQSLYFLIHTALKTGAIVGNNIIYASPQEINRRENKDKVWKKLGVFYENSPI